MSNVNLSPYRYTHQHVFTTVQYSKAMPLSSAQAQLTDLSSACQKVMASL